MEYVTVIKVLKRMDSAFDHGKYTLRYSPCRWTYPIVGKIYAFQDYEHAIRWAIDYPGDSLWEAEAEIFKEGNCLACIDDDSCISDFWKWYSMYPNGNVTMCPSCLATSYTPNGTVLCNKLRITRKLKDI